MFKNSKPYLLATILIGMGLANLFRSLDAVHHTINLLGLTLLLYSLLFKKWTQYVAQRNGDFITPEYSKVGSDYYDTKTGERIKPNKKLKDLL